MNILFWNICGKNLLPLVANLAAAQSCDFVILAEPSRIDPSELVAALMDSTGSAFTFHSSPIEQRLRIFSNLPFSNVASLYDGPDHTIRSVISPGCLPITLVAVHSPSQRDWARPTDRLALAIDIRESLEAVELREGHRRSLIVGDFNTDPFDDALISSHGLHAVMTRDVARAKQRTVNGRSHYFMYNPMFSLLGDFSRGPPGSYYYRKSIPTCRFWHLYDQVLLRPELIPSFDDSSLHVLDSFGSTSLAKASGQPDSNLASDHFPLVFSLDLLGHFPNV